VTKFDDDVDLIGRLTDEMTDHARIHGNMTIELSPLTVLQVASILQLARRDVIKASTMRTLTADLLALIRVYFDDCPTALAILDAGERATISAPKTTH